MKEYKILKVGIFKKDVNLEEELNQLAREGWRVSSATHDHGRFVKILLERDKNRM